VKNPIGSSLFTYQLQSLDTPKKFNLQFALIRDEFSLNLLDIKNKKVYVLAAGKKL